MPDVKIRALEGLAGTRHVTGGTTACDHLLRSAEALRSWNGVENMISDGIAPPLSDLESEVLPLHHEALQQW